MKLMSNNYNCFSCITHTAKHRKELFDLLEVGLIGAVLYRIVKKRRAYGIRIKLHSQNYLRNGNGMRYIRLTALTELPLVEHRRIFIRLYYLLFIVILPRGIDIEQKLFYRCGFCNICFVHKLYSLILNMYTFH